MAAGLATASSPRTVAGSYSLLFNVQFQHDYYNVSGKKCPDFKVVPTPDCTNLMTSLGMLFKDHGTGFSVMIDRSRVPALIDYVRNLYSSDAPGAGYWSWLSFLLVPANPLFVGITSLPIATNPMTQNLHVSNLATSAEGGALSLSGSTGQEPQSLYPVTGSSLSVPSPASGTVSLSSLSGAAVPVPATATEATTGFDLTKLPYGFYALAFANASGKRVPAPKGYSVPTSYLYLPSSPLSLCVLDLLLAQPAKGVGDPDAYPIPPLPAAGPIQPVTLVLPFQARETYWRYYIVPQGGSGQLGDALTISGAGAGFARSDEQLPNGDRAVLFTAESPLPLQQQSQFRFKLTGQRKGANGSRDDISVDRLPTAPSAPVWPAPSEPLSGSSEIYVYV